VSDDRAHVERAAQLIRVAPHDLLHPERGVARPHSVVFVGEGGAKERHDSVAHHLVDGPFVAVMIRSARCFEM